MPRKVFFSFHYDRDAWRVGQVRNSSNLVKNYEKNPFFVDKAKWESVKNNSAASTQRWIDEQLRGSSVTVVLVGKETAARKWVQYEIRKSIELGKGLLAVDISKIKDSNGETDPGKVLNPLPKEYPMYYWNNDKGAEKLGSWIEKAAHNAGW